ncbi:MAG: glycosyltransferase family 4 protein [Planctomycetes bacterium]|nr:glycosyltransferase family 4 protein [Planctomycetota bacterium]
MRVAILIERFAAKGGAERMAGAVAAGLLARRHEVHVFAGAFDDAPVVRHEIPRGSHTAFARRCREALRGERFDVVHSFTRTLAHDILRLGGGIHAEYLRRVEPARGPLDRMWSRVNPKERAILKLEREGLRAARIVQAVSERVKREAMEHYGVDPARIVVMHNGVDTSRFHPDLRRHRATMLAELGLPADAFVTLFVGSGARRKGLATALRAFELLSDPRDHLIVVGDAPASSSAPRVRFVGVRPDIERFYGTADALLLPTLYDPFPNVCLEALASGVPVVVTRVAGVSEIITDGVDSFVVDDPGEPVAIADRLRRIRSSGDAMRRAARALAERHPIERYVEETLALYGRVGG